MDAVLKTCIILFNYLLRLPCFEMPQRDLIERNTSNSKPSASLVHKKAFLPKFYIFLDSVTETLLYAS